MGKTIARKIQLYVRLKDDNTADVQAALLEMHDQTIRVVDE